MGTFLSDIYTGYSCRKILRDIFLGTFLLPQIIALISDTHLYELVSRSLKRANK